MPVNAKLGQENFERYAYARDNGHMDFVRKADECDRYYQGMQWDDAVREKLKRQGKPALTINKILATITTVQGELINNRADIAFRPAQDGTEETAHALSRVYKHVHQINDLDWVEQDVADDGFITGRGFYDCRVEFDDNLFGNIKVRQLNPRNVAIDPDASNYDPDEWAEVFTTRWMNPLQIGITYSEADAEILRQRQHSDFMYGYDSIERVPQTFGSEFTRHSGYPHTQDPQLRRHIRIIERQHWKRRAVWTLLDPATGDMKTVPENWDEDHVRDVAHRYRQEVIKRSHKQIRWTVTADTVVLHDDWSPYQHFTVVPYFPFFRRGQTIGLVESLLGSQEQLNKTASQELHIINTTANSGWKVKQGSLTNMTSEELEERGAETGLVIEYNAERADAIEKIQPNQVPTGLDRVSTKSDMWIKELSGVSDSMRGFDRSDVAAKAIEAKQQQGSTNLAKPFENLRRTRYMLARRILSLLQTYYTEPRTLRITGERPSDQPEDIPINQYDPQQDRMVNDLMLGKYDVIITSRPPRETYDEDQFQEALRMRTELGVPIPDRVLIEYSHLEKKHEILEELGQDSNEVERQQREQQAQLEAQSKQAELMKSQAEAQLSKARAEKVMAETRGEIPNDEQAAQEAKDSMEFRIKQAEIASKERIEQQKLEFERQKHREELEAQIAYQEEQLEIQRMEAKNKSSESSSSTASQSR